MERSKQPTSTEICYDPDNNNKQAVLPNLQHQLTVRFLNPSEFHRIKDIDEVSFSDPEARDDCAKLLKTRYTLGKLALLDDKVCGYIIYKISNDGDYKRYSILKIAVSPDHSRQGIELALIKPLKDNIANKPGSTITARVPEDNLQAHLLLKSAGFKCSSTIKESDDQGQRDTYVFNFFSASL